MKEINRMRDGVKIDTSKSVEIVELVKYGGIILEVFEGFFCDNLKHSTYTEFVTDLFENRDLFKSQIKKLLQNLPKRLDCQSTVVIDINEE